MRQLETWSPRPHELINSEIEAQAARLRGLVEQLRSVIALADRPGVIAVPDTHVWLHYERFDQVEWREIVGADKVRLVIPLRILEELDEKTYARRADLRRRADKVLAALDPVLDKAADGPVEVRPGVTLEILSDGSAGSGAYGLAVRQMPERLKKPLTSDTGEDAEHDTRA